MIVSPFVSPFFFFPLSLYLNVEHFSSKYRYTHSFVLTAFNSFHLQMNKHISFILSKLCYKRFENFRVVLPTFLHRINNQINQYLILWHMLEKKKIPDAGNISKYFANSHSATFHPHSCKILYFISQFILFPFREASLFWMDNRKDPFLQLQSVTSPQSLVLWPMSDGSNMSPGSMPLLFRDIYRNKWPLSFICLGFY